MVAHEYSNAIDSSFRATSSQRTNVVSGHDGNAGACRVVENGLADGMLGPPFDRRGQPDDRLRRQTVECDHVHHLRVTFRQGPRLVERDAADTTRALQV